MCFGTETKHVRTRQSREQAAPVHPLGVRALVRVLRSVSWNWCVIGDW